MLPMPAAASKKLVDDLTNLRNRIEEMFLIERRADFCFGWLEQDEARAPSERTAPNLLAPSHSLTMGSTEVPCAGQVHRCLQKNLKRMRSL